MATTVQLNLVVDEKGGLAGFDRFRAGEKAAMTAVTADMKTFTTQTQQLAATSEASGQKVQGAFRGIESATLRARIAERVLIQELGIELPGVLSKVAAKSQTLGPIFAAAFGAAIFTTAIGALGGIANKIVEVSQALGGYTEQVKKMEEETIKASRQAFLSPETVDVTFKHLQEVNAKIEELKKKKDALNEVQQKSLTSNPFSQESGYGPDTTLTEEENRLLGERNKLEKDDNDLLAQQSALKDHINQQTKDLVANADREASLAGLQGFAKIAAEKEYALGQIRDTIGAETGVRDQVLADKEKVFAAQSIQLARQNAQATLQLRHQVTDETLSDELKIREDEKFSIQELDALRRQSLISRADYEARAVLIHQEANNKQKALDLEVVKIQQDAENFVLQIKAQSLTGEERLYAERNLKIKALEDELGRLRAGPIGDKEVAQMAAISEKEIAIVQETEDQITALRKESADKRALLLEQSDEQIRDAETAAALATVPPWQRAYAQIVVESNKRLQQIDKEERNQLAKYTEGSEEYVAITKVAEAKRAEVHAETDQKVIEENKRMVDQLGSELESVFNDIGSGNIGKRILKNMEKLFFDILAQWILSLGQMKSGAGSILGSLVFGPGSTGANVFGGGGNAGGGLGGLLGGLFGGSTTTVGGTPPFVPPGISGQAPTLSSPLPSTSTGGLIPGGTSSSSGAGTGTDPFASFVGDLLGTASPSNTVAGTPSFTGASTSSVFGNGLSAGLSTASSLLVPSGPLSTQSISDVLGGGILGGGSSQPSSASSSGGLAGLGKLLTGGAGAKGLLGLGALLGPLLGAGGGKIGSIGGTILGLGLAGQLSGVVSGLFASIGALGASAVLGAATGGLIGFGLGQNFGGGIGALSGAGTGALTGFLVGGPVGAIIGGIIGLIGGIFGGIFGGSKRKKQANSLVDGTVLPDIKKIVEEYESFQLDFAGANKQLDDLDTQSKAELDKLKGEGKSVFDKRVEPAIDDARKQIKADEDERQRRSGLVFGPPQFHEGGFVSSPFSSFTTRPGELMAVLKHGEFVVNPQDTSRNRQTLERINSGGSVTGDMHFYAPLIQAQRVDEAWLRNGGAQQILDALRRARYEGLQ